MYDPVLGVFITADTVIPGGGFDPQMLNRYVYCRNNPLKYTDPSGHEHTRAPRGLAGVVMGPAGVGIIGVAGIALNNAYTRVRGRIKVNAFNFGIKIFIKAVEIYAKTTASDNTDENPLDVNEGDDSDENQDESDNSQPSTEEIANRIAKGHGREKHNPRTSVEDLSELIEETIKEGEKKDDLDLGRTGYRNKDTGRVVVIDPGHEDYGTTLVPEDQDFWDNLE